MGGHEDHQNATGVKATLRQGAIETSNDSHANELNLCASSSGSHSVTNLVNPPASVPSVRTGSG